MFFEIKFCKFHLQMKKEKRLIVSNSCEIPQRKASKRCFIVDILTKVDEQ